MELDPGRFTRRVNQSYDVPAIQLKVAHEDIARDCDGYGGVDVFDGTLFPTNDDVSMDDMVTKVAAQLGPDADVTWCYNVTKVKRALVATDEVVLSFDTSHGSDHMDGITGSVAVRSDWTIEKIIALIEEHGVTVGKELIRDDKAPISFAMPSNSGVHIINKKFGELTLNGIAENYGENVIKQSREMVTAMTESSNGILILNGPPGTGKSYLIRSMLWELKGIRHPIVCTPPQQFLTQMGLLTEAIMSVDDEDDYPPAMRHKTSKEGTLIVMEDVGEMLMYDNVTNHVNETANLLNFADGLLSLLANTLFILTFNTEIEKINPALTRPGRCLGHLTINLLDYHQAEKLTGLNLDPAREYSLAEVYEMKRTGEPSKGNKRSVLGFGH